MCNNTHTGALLKKAAPPKVGTDYDFVYLVSMKRIFRRFLPLLILGAFTTVTLDGCFIFKGKNNCGDCPNFKKNSKPKKAKKRH